MSISPPPTKFLSITKCPIHRLPLERCTELDGTPLTVRKGGIQYDVYRCAACYTPWHLNARPVIESHGANATQAPLPGCICPLCGGIVRSEEIDHSENPVWSDIRASAEEGDHGLR